MDDELEDQLCKYREAKQEQREERMREGATAFHNDELPPRPALSYVNAENEENVDYLMGWLRELQSVLLQVRARQANEEE